MNFRNLTETKYVVADGKVEVAARVKATIYDFDKLKVDGLDMSKLNYSILPKLPEDEGGSKTELMKELNKTKIYFKEEGVEIHECMFHDLHRFYFNFYIVWLVRHDKESCLKMYLSS